MAGYRFFLYHIFTAIALSFEFPIPGLQTQINFYSTNSLYFRISSRYCSPIALIDIPFLET